MYKLSKIQKDLLDLVKDRTSSLTLDEMAHELGLSGKSSVHYHIHELVRKGNLKINQDNPGHYTVIDDVKEGIAYLPVYEAQGGASGRSPLEYPIDDLPVPSRFLNFDTSSTLAIKIKGNSMYPNFPDGSYVMVDKNDNMMEENKTYLLLLNNNELVVKNVATDRFHTGKFILSSFNYLVQPPFIADIYTTRIIGKVKACINQFN